MLILQLAAAAGDGLVHAWKRFDTAPPVALLLGGLVQVVLG